MATNYILLERIKLNTSAANITFSNIPQSGYTDLKVVASMRIDQAANSNGARIRFNGVTTNYAEKTIFANGSAASSASQTLGTEPGIIFWWVPGASSTASTFSNSEFYVPNYTSSNYKSVSADSVTENNSTTAYTMMTAGYWQNTAAITSITLEPASGNFVQYSTFSLYGLAASGASPSIAPKASGGNITTDGTYWYHTFLTSGTFTPSISLSCDVLQIAGGGGGGSYRGAGGGAGGLLAYTAQSLTAMNYSVTIGAGGTGGTESPTYATGNIGTSGNASQFASLTSSAGGGYGGSPGTYVAGASGGSGGGSSADPTYQPNPGGSASPSGQGNAGGAGNTFGGPYYGAGGGGGASAAGTAGTTSGGGAGGAGTSSYSSWGAATYTGQNSGGTYYYAGGGAGGGIFSAPSVSGGVGGGGSSPSNSNGSAATANTGGGGGGANSTSDNVKNSGGNGGSGIVIIRYAMA